MNGLIVAGVGSFVVEGSPPPAALLPPALRRRTSLLCRVVAEAASRALARGGADPARTPVVYGSVYGETSAAVEMMRSFTQGEGLPSPTTFHNSVHNAPAGYLSIATGCHAFSTSIAAGPETPAMALLEAWLVLTRRGGDAVVVLADEPVPEPLGLPEAFPVAAVAFHLRSAPGGPALARLGLPRRGPGLVPPAPAALAGHPCAAAFRLAAAVEAGIRGTVSLGDGSPDGWTVDLEEAG